MLMFSFHFFPFTIIILRLTGGDDLTLVLILSHLKGGARLMEGDTESTGAVRISQLIVFYM